MIYAQEDQEGAKGEVQILDRASNEILFTVETYKQKSKNEVRVEQDEV